MYRLFMSILLVLLVFSCSKKKVETTLAEIELIKIMPATSSVLSKDAIIRVVYNRPPIFKREDISFAEAGGNDIIESITVSGDTLVIRNNPNSIKSEANYILLLMASSISDVDLNIITEPGTATYTIKDFLAPVVESSTPMNNQYSVPTTLDAITLIFNEKIKSDIRKGRLELLKGSMKLTIDPTFIVLKADATNGKDTVVIGGFPTLEENTTYAFKFGRGFIDDTSSNPVEILTLLFTTRANSPPVLTTIPVNGAENVMVDLSAILLNFGNKSVTILDTASANYMLMGGGISTNLSPVLGDGIVATSPNISIPLPDLLQESTRYTVMINAGVFQDVDGNGNEEINFSFTTADNTSPTILISSIAGDSVSFATFTEVTYTYSESIEVVTTDKSNAASSLISILPVTSNTDATVVIQSITASGDKLTIIFGSVKPGVNYRFTIKPGAVKDISLNANLSTETGEYEVRTGPDEGNPRKILSQPSSGEVEVVRNIGRIILHFSKEVQNPSLSNISLIAIMGSDESAVTLSAVSVENDSVVTVIFLEELSNLTNYRVSVAAGFVQSTSNVGNIGFSFDFISDDENPPTLIGSVPIDSAINVNRNLRRIVLNFNEPISISNQSKFSLSGSTASISDITVLFDTIVQLTLSPLVSGTPIFTEKEEYTLSIATGAVTDDFENINDRIFTVVFTIRDETAPILLSADPSGFGSDIADVDQLVFTFDEDINIIDDTKISPPEGTSIDSVRAVGNIVTVFITPSITAVGSYTYSFQGDNTDGFAFSDTAQPVNRALGRGFSFSIGDVIPPTAVRTLPSLYSLVTNSILTIEFDENLTENIDITKISIIGAFSGAIVSAVRSVSNPKLVRVTLDNSKLGAVKRIYNINIDSGFVVDNASNFNILDATLVFNVLDEVKPQLVASSPGSGIGDVTVLLSAIQITFDEFLSQFDPDQINVASSNHDVVIDNIELTDNGNNKPNSLLIITFKSSFRENTEYTVSILQNAVEDQSANKNSDTQFSFTTGSDDKDPLLVASNIDITNDEFFVSTSLDTIVLEYDEDVQVQAPASITLSKDGGAAISIATITTELNKVFIPIMGLELNSAYTLTIGADALSDFANRYASAVTPKFQTLSVTTVVAINTAFISGGSVIWADGSGGGGGAILKPSSRSSYNIEAGRGANGLGSGTTIDGTEFSDIIFADGSGGGSGHAYSALGSVTKIAGGVAGGGHDTINGGAGDDIIFADGFSGDSGVAHEGNTNLNILGSLGGYGGGGASGSLLAVAAGAVSSVPATQRSIGGGYGGGASNSGATSQVVDSGGPSINVSMGGSGAFVSDGIKLLAGGSGSGVNGVDASLSNALGANASLSSSSNNVRGLPGGSPEAGSITKDLSNVATFRALAPNVFFAEILSDINFSGSFTDDSRIWGDEKQERGAGNDVINGGAGNDVILGMGGINTFIIDFSVGVNGEVDHILDFKVTDTIKIIGTNGMELFVNTMPETVQLVHNEGVGEYGAYRSVYIIEGAATASEKGKYLYLYDHHVGATNSDLSLTEEEIIGTFATELRISP